MKLFLVWNKVLIWSFYGQALTDKHSTKIWLSTYPNGQTKCLENCGLLMSKNTITDKTYIPYSSWIWLFFFHSDRYLKETIINLFHTVMTWACVPHNFLKFFFSCYLCKQSALSFPSNWLVACCEWKIFG